MYCHLLRRSISLKCTAPERAVQTDACTRDIVCDMFLCSRFSLPQMTPGKIPHLQRGPGRCAHRSIIRGMKRCQAYPGVRGVWLGDSCPGSVHCKLWLGNLTVSGLVGSSVCKKGVLVGRHMGALAFVCVWGEESSL